jgi:nickel/cobalt transporter (NiCoT) family protein
VPLPALLIITFIALLNCVVWAICALILHNHGSLMATAALAYSLGLRHAFDADHISAIDLMTRRLLAGNPKSRPVTVGTWFSLGHSTIVIITSIVVAATAAGISKHFGSFGLVGGIVGTSVSAAFLILLGAMNAYILYKLIVQMNRLFALPVGAESSPAALKFEGGGPLFRVLKRMFKLIDRPWKMYPIGVLFGLGFDTSTEIALLGIASIQGSEGTNIWLILVFPVLFTAGMCLVDTIDGAMMLAIYVGPIAVSGVKGDEAEQEGMIEQGANDVNNERLKDPIMFLYYSIVLTVLTVVVALIIGTIQLLTIALNVTEGKGKFWDGVAVVGDDYEIIGGAICGSFIVVGATSVLCYKPWRRRVEERRRARDEMNGVNPDSLEEDGDVVVEETEVQILGKDRDGKIGNTEASTITGAGSSRRTGELDDRIEPV